MLTTGASRAALFSLDTVNRLDCEPTSQQESAFAFTFALAQHCAASRDVPF